MSEISMALETITPEIAAEMLTHNTKNRTLSSGTVTNYARQMREGNWLLNGDAIRFSETGVLLDGQHRLAAIIQSGLPVQTWVGRGFPNETQMTMDAQRKRTAGDVLGIEGIANGNKVAATIRMVNRWEAGERSMYGFGGQANHLSTIEVAQIALADPAYAEAIANTHMAHPLAPPRVCGTLYFLAARIDVQRTNEFFHPLGTGAGLQIGDPILTLRNHWQRLSRSSASVPGGQYLNAGVRCWNAFVTGRSLATIAYKTPIIPELSRPRKSRKEVA